MKRIVGLSIFIILIGLNLYAGDLTVVGTVNFGARQNGGPQPGYLGNTWTPAEGYKFSYIGSTYFDGTNWITNANAGFGSNNVAEIGLDASGIKFYAQRAATGNTQRTDSTAIFETYERMRIDKDGNVGIGTTTPGQKLDVQGGYVRASNSVAGPAAFMEGGASVAYFGALDGRRASFGNSENWETLTVDNGNVGIGTTNPKQVLQVNTSFGLGSGGGVIWPVFDRDASDGGLFIRSYNDTNQTYSNLVKINANGNVGIGKNPEVKLDVNGNIKISGSINPYLQINDGTYNGYIEATGGSLRSYWNGRVGWVQTADGDVGIGKTQAPGVKLDVNGTTYVEKLLTTGNNSYNPADPKAADIVVGSDAGARHDSSVMFWSSASASRLFNQNDVFYMSPWHMDAVTGANVALAAGTGNSYIKNGSVGIGTTDPTLGASVSNPKLSIAGPTGDNARLGMKSAKSGAYTWWLYAADDAFGLGGGTDGKVGKIQVANNGNVGIGDSTPDYKLVVKGGIICEDPDGDDTCNAPVQSDIRLKTNIRNITHALDKVEQLQGVEFNYTKATLPKGNQIGFIAQHLEKVYPELIYEDMDGYKMIDYQKLTAVLTEAIKEQQKQINELKADITLLKKTR